jgi:hypothetical protein
MKCETTLARILAKGPCDRGWATLLKHLNKTEPDNEPLPLSVILTSNGLDDALWCLRAVPAASDSLVRQYTVWCARQAQHLMRGELVGALDTADKFIKGEIDRRELDKAYMCALRIPTDRWFVSGRAEAEAAAMSTLATVSMYSAMPVTRKAADALARHGAAAADGSDASYATAFAAACAAQIQKFREMFCTYESQPVTEAIE